MPTVCNGENRSRNWQPKCKLRRVPIANQRALIALAIDERRAPIPIGKILPYPRLAAVAIVFVGILRGASQQSASSDPLNRDTPQSTVSSFQEAYHSHDYLRAAKYLDLRKFPRTARLKEGRGLAQQLGEILDRDAQFDVADLSPDSEGASGATPAGRERVDSFTIDGQTLDLDVERVKLRSGISVWLFSDDSVERIPRIARVTSDSPVERYLPEPLVAWTFLDTSLWRWIALALLTALVFGLATLLARLVLRLVQPALKRIAPRVDWSALESLLGPLQLLFAVAAFRAGVEWIDPSVRVREYLEKGLALFFLLGLAWLGLRIVDLIIGRLGVVLRSKHESFSYSVLPLASRVLKIAILLLMVAAVLSDWGYNTNTIVAGLGVGGIAIALAAQKTIENFFGGVAVVSDRPVSIGDFCKFGDRVGTVEDIGLRSTRIRTLDRTLVTVPNGQFSSMTLENFDRRDKMLFHFMLNLRRDIRPDQVRALLASITKMLAQRPKLETGALPVRFVGVGTYSLDIEIYVHVLTRNGDEFMKIQQELYLWILDAVEAAGTSLALPTQASIEYASIDPSKPDDAPEQRKKYQLTGPSGKENANGH